MHDRSAPTNHVVIDLTATHSQYFTGKFTCPKDSNSSCYGFEDTFENYFSVASMLPIFIMGGVNVWLQSK